MTVRTLILVRHGDASSRASRDIARELSSAGRAQTRELGRLLALEHPHVDVAAVSGAARARQTFEELSFTIDVASSWTDEVVYTADATDLIHLARSFSGECGLIVGHAPTIGETGWELACEEDRKSVTWSVPTATAVLATFEGEWRELARKSCTVSLVHSPLVPEAL